MAGDNRANAELAEVRGRDDALLAQQAARVVRAFDAFEAAAPGVRRRLTAELSAEVRALKIALLRRKLADVDSTPVYLTGRRARG